MELAGRHAADAARDLVGDRDRENQVAARDRPRLGQRERRGNRRDCSCGRSTRCACRRTRAPAATTALANAAVVTPTRSPVPKMRHGPGGDIAMRRGDRRAAERRLGAGIARGRSRRECAAWSRRRRRRQIVERSPRPTPRPSRAAHATAPRRESSLLTRRRSVAATTPAAAASARAGSRSCAMQARRRTIRSHR